MQIKLPPTVPKIRLLQRKIAAATREPRSSKVTDKVGAEVAIESGEVILEGPKAVARIKKHGYEDRTQHVLTFQVIPIS